ncbi:hypothetical protein EYR40_009534 [Pleurotus pulmonarius]|nr:hypothetical protein EYR40_009534 [Pleurotus pulmonarius]
MVRYIECDELAALMRSDKVAKKDFIVVDVRDDDRVGGHIKDSLNIPSAEFLMNVDKLVKETKEVPFLVFHCALSQVRYAIRCDSSVVLDGTKRVVIQRPQSSTGELDSGAGQYPRADARKIYEETRKNILEGEDIPHEVVILRDGFTLFQTKFKNEKDLVEEWDKDTWEPEWQLMEERGFLSVNRP